MPHLNGHISPMEDSFAVSRMRGIRLSGSMWREAGGGVRTALYRKLVQITGCEEVAGVASAVAGTTVEFDEVVRPPKILFAKDQPRLRIDNDHIRLVGTCTLNAALGQCDIVHRTDTEYFPKKARFRRVDSGEGWETSIQIGSDSRRVTLDLVFGSEAYESVRQYHITLGERQKWQGPPLGIPHEILSKHMKVLHSIDVQV